MKKLLFLSCFGNEAVYRHLNQPFNSTICFISKKRFDWMEPKDCHIMFIPENKWRQAMISRQYESLIEETIPKIFQKSGKIWLIVEERHEEFLLRFLSRSEKYYDVDVFESEDFDPDNNLVFFNPRDGHFFQYAPKASAKPFGIVKLKALNRVILPLN